MSVEKKFFLTLSGFSLLFNNLTQKIMKANFEKMDVPFIVAHIIKQAMAVAKPANNGKLRISIHGGDDYEPVYLNREEQEEAWAFLFEIFGDEIID